MKAEFSFWLQAVRTAVTHPGPVIVVMAFTWFAWPMGGGTLGAGVAVLVIARAWCHLDPVRASQFSGVVRGQLWRWRIKREWAQVCLACGLSKHGLPIIRRVRVAYPHVAVTVRPVRGQTARLYEEAAEAIRVSLGASRVRVDQPGPRDVVLTITTEDDLVLPVTARVPDMVAGFDSIEIGRREDGRPWRLPIGPHTLIAGCSGSGKGSVFWSVAFGLAPAVREGRVQLHGIDLKGGMEILMGRSLFTTAMTCAEDAVAVLELLVEWMRQRTKEYAGRLRMHTPTNEEPLHVVMIDELAALTAYCADRDLQRRAELALSLLCSQGRAPGFMVLACLQDPRKEVIPTRGLFTQMVGLRLKDASETSMVLGEFALLSGAHCHRIARDQPGTGYVLPEEGGHPIRVRAGFASDKAIREVARQFASPTHIASEEVARFVETSSSRARGSSRGMAT